MRIQLFKLRLLSLATLCSMALVFASCANEDVAQGGTESEKESDKNFTTFVTGDAPTTRTSMDYDTGAFYWEAGDYNLCKE